MVKQAGFLFAGQGAQYVGMGRELAETVPAAANLFAKMDATLGRNLTAICQEGPAASLTATENSQPAIYTMNLACLEALKSRTNATPAMCAGLSLGELSAAACSGAYNFETGLQLVEKRCRAMQEACEVSEGSMAAVLNAETELIQRVCDENNIYVANFNCPGQVVISGSKDGVKAAIKALKEAGVKRVIPLKVAGAFHSPLMASAAESFGRDLEKITFSDAHTPLVQNVVGEPASDSTVIRENLKNQISGSVRWETSIRSMMDHGITHFIEFGPGKTLTGFLRRIDRNLKGCNVESVDDLANAEAFLADCPEN